MFYEYANAFNYKHFKNEELIFQMTEEKSVLFLLGCVEDIYNNNLSCEYIQFNVNYRSLRHNSHSNLKFMIPEYCLYCDSKY